MPNPAGTTWSIDAPNTTEAVTLSGNALSFGPQDLAPGATVSVHLTSPTSSASSRHPNKSCDCSSDVCSSDLDSASITVNCGAIELTKAADAGTVSAGDP